MDKIIDCSQENTVAMAEDMLKLLTEDEKISCLSYAQNQLQSEYAKAQGLDRLD